MTRTSASLAPLALVASCARDPGPSPGHPDQTPPLTDGGATTPLPSDGGATPAGPLERPFSPLGTSEPKDPTPRTHTYACPQPPRDALTFSAGTVLADQRFLVDNDPSYGPMPSGWTLVVTGASYTHADSCETLVRDQALWVPIKDGSLPGEYLFELVASVPGRTVTEFLGEHEDNGGLVANPRFSAHWVRIGWHDGEDYHWVDSLPHGWTKSTICVGELSQDHAYITVLFDPVDGPYLTNHRNPLTQKIWFDMEILATGKDPRSCFVTGWQEGIDRDAVLGVSSKKTEPSPAPAAPPPPSR